MNPALPLLPAITARGFRSGVASTVARREVMKAVTISGRGPLGLAEVEGDSLALGLIDALTDGDTDGDSLALGLVDALAEADGDGDSVGLSLGEVLELGLGVGD